MIRERKRFVFTSFIGQSKETIVERKFLEPINRKEGRKKEREDILRLLLKYKSQNQFLQSFVNSLPNILDTFISTMATDRKRARQLKSHINQLYSELRTIDPDGIPHIQLFNLSISSQLTSFSHHHYEHICPYVSSEKKSEILHSTANPEYRRKKSKKIIFAASACATSTPKSLPNSKKIFLKPTKTSTPRRSKHHSTPVQPVTVIPIKRLMYKKDSNQHKRRHLNFIEENPQWI